MYSYINNINNIIVTPCIFSQNQHYHCIWCFTYIFTLFAGVPCNKHLAGHSRKYQTAGLPCKQKLMIALQVLPQIAFLHAGFDHGYKHFVVYWDQIYKCEFRILNGHWRLCDFIVDLSLIMLG